MTPTITPRGIRNNNPGNIRLSSDRWRGLRSVQADPKFFQFESMAYGYRAMMVILRNYQRKYGLRTVADIISRWAPPIENDTANYLSSVCKDLQVPTTHKLDLDNSITLIALAAAISKVENGKPAVMADVIAGYDLM